MMGSSTTPKHDADDGGHCVMRGHCGTKTRWGGKSLPCPFDGPPEQPEDNNARELLVSVCGAKFAQEPVCCNSEQVQTLKENFDTVEPLLASCPACRNNFREFFCSFTCSLQQAEFLNVTATQETWDGHTGINSVDFFVSEDFGHGFYDSCKSVQVGATNSYAMDFIGGGAKNYQAFFKFLGDEKPIGSPFQINFPSSLPSGFSAFNETPRSCSDNDLSSRCTCIDCPDICQTLPYVPPPGSAATCHVGPLSCLSFILVLGYSVAVAAFLAGFLLQDLIRRRREKLFNGLDIAGSESLDTQLSPRTHSRGLVGASSLSHQDGDDSLGTPSESRHLGRGASLLDPIDTVQPRQYPLNTILRRYFYRLGLATATYPWATFAVVFTLIALLNLGWKRFEVETDPVRLWVAPDSESKIQKEFFDDHFGPFFRTQQIFVTSAGSSHSSEPTLENESSLLVPSMSEGKGPVLSWDTLNYWFKIEAEIRALRSPKGYRLADVCFKPSGPRGACVFHSVGGWFGNTLDDDDPDTWTDHLLTCANSPVECLPDFQQPLEPQFVLGGVPLKSDGSKDYLGAQAMVITIVVANSLDEGEVARAEDWERTLRAYLERLQQRAPEDAGLHIEFSTEISITEEINKSTNMDVKIVVLSYIAMFFYIALTLGSGSQTDEEGVGRSLKRWAHSFPKLFKRSSLASSSLSVDSSAVPTIFPRLPRKLFVGSKFALGLFGILLVILSVSSSVGLFSAIGVKVTLIIAEVIPFLVLAVGVDNVFILVHELDRQNLLHGPNATGTTNGIGRGLGSPNGGGNGTGGAGSIAAFDTSHDDSIEAVSVPLFFTAEERVARALAKMGPSILLSTVSETTAFALGALVPMPAVRNFALYAAGSVLLNAVLQITVFVSAMTLDLRRVEASRVDCFPCIRLPPRIALLEGPPGGGGLGRIAKFMRRHYAPLLLKPVVKGGVIAFFSGLFVASVISIQHIQLGLDQRLALPSDSYLVGYFNSLETYLDIGPPVYFVVHDTDVTQRPAQQALCGRFTTCDDYSIANVLEAERKRPGSSFINQPSAVWIDDFFNWLNPSQSMCCRVRKRDPDNFCTPRERERLCQPCLEGQDPGWNVTMEGLPEGAEFMRYLRQWWESPTNADCLLAGGASFGTALSISSGGDMVEASHFRTYHSPLKSQDDFINAFAAAHRIADDLSRRTGAKVFPYSLFYVFFDQYAHIVAITQEILGLGLAAVLVVTALLLGSWRTGTIVTGVVALTVTTCMGVMGIWGISLNAISLVNLVISLGIAVEFCAHVARAFMSAGSGLPVDHPAGQKERDERMYTALVDVGPSVLSGITFTKLIGMSVLALTHSKLLEIYYFRMWFSLIIAGALHGLVLLPVVLSLAGGPGYPFQEADEEWMSNAIRDDYEYAPFLADDDSVASD